jgi:hypothetical protein
MPHAGKLLQFLRTLNTDELRALKSTHTARLNGNPNKDELIKQLNRALGRRIKKGDLTFGEVARSAVRQARKDDRTKVVPYIVDALKEMTFTKAVMRKDSRPVRESRFTSEAFQVLNREFRDRPYVVSQEKKFDSIRVDLCVSKSDGGAHYPIEVKRFNKKEYTQSLSGQLNKHRKYVPNHRYSFALIICEKESFRPGNCTDRSRVVAGVKNRKDAKPVVKGPESIRG